MLQEGMANAEGTAKVMGRYICEQFKEYNLTVVNIYKVDFEATIWREAPFVIFLCSYYCTIYFITDLQTAPAHIHSLHQSQLISPADTSFWIISS